MCTLAIWFRVVQSHDVSPHDLDGHTTSGLEFSVAPSMKYVCKKFLYETLGSRHQ